MKRLAPLVLMLLTACSATPAATPTPTPSYVCEDVSDLANSILEYAEHTALEAWAVRDEAHAKAYYVAIKLAGDDEADGKVALWVTNSLTIPASIRSVDATALAISEWPDGEGEGFDATEPAAVAAKACID